MTRYYYRNEYDLSQRMETLRFGQMARQGVASVEELIRQKLAEIRKWKLTSLGKRHPKWGFQFTVMTYNILSQTAVDNHMYLYKNCSPNFLSEDYRISRILPEILRTKSDIICLQEVEQSLFESRIKSVFHSNGFQSIFKKRAGCKTDGCAILWRVAKFNLLTHREIDFKIKNCDLLNRENVGVIAVLRPRHPNAGRTQVHVGTTHLIFNPRRGDVKLCQLRLLLAELEKSALKRVSPAGRVYHPTILCGDFNFEPHSPLYSFVETGRLDVSNLKAGSMSGQQEGNGKGKEMDSLDLSLDHVGVDQAGRLREISSVDAGVENSDNSIPSVEGSEGESDCTSQIFYHDFSFRPVYKYPGRDRQSAPVTSMTDNDCNAVDHIFYGVKEKCPGTFSEGPLKLLAALTLPSEENLRDFGGLPNAHMGSDHVKLVAKFVLSLRP